MVVATYFVERKQINDRTRLGLYPSTTTILYCYPLKGYTAPKDIPACLSGV